MATIQVRVGRAVRKLREAAGLSQERTAALAGVDRTGYSRLERGRVGPSVVILERVLKVLHVSWTELGAAIDAEH